MHDSEVQRVVEVVQFRDITTVKDGKRARCRHCEAEAVRDAAFAAAVFAVRRPLGFPGLGEVVVFVVSDADVPGGARGDGLDLVEEMLPEPGVAAGVADVADVGDEGGVGLERVEVVEEVFHGVEGFVLEPVEGSVRGVRAHVAEEEGVGGGGRGVGGDEGGFAPPG